MACISDDAGKSDAGKISLPLLTHPVLTANLDFNSPNFDLEAWLKTQQ